MNLDDGFWLTGFDKVKSLAAAASLSLPLMVGPPLPLFLVRFDIYETMSTKSIQWVRQFLKGLSDSGICEPLVHQINYIFCELASHFFVLQKSKR